MEQLSANADFLHPTASQEPNGKIVFPGSLLQQAIGSDNLAITTLFQQFIPSDEAVKQVDYNGYFGFWFVGFHSFSCLTEKRLATLRVGPFKKVIYQDGFYESMTSGGVYQPTKFWLYVMQFLGLILGFAFFGALIYTIISFLFYQVFSERISEGLIFFVSAVGALVMLPFVGHSVSMLFYRFNPCGLACWVRARTPVIVFISRSKMLQANRLYRLWSTLREARNRSIKNKFRP